MALVTFVNDSAPYLNADNLNNNFQWLNNLFMIDTQRSDTCSLVANGKNTFNINVERTGYTPLGVLFIDSSNNDIDIMKYSQFGNTVYVRLLNTSNSNIEFTINVKVLYQKN